MQVQNAARLLKQAKFLAFVIYEGDDLGFFLHVETAPPRPQPLWHRSGRWC